MWYLRANSSNLDGSWPYHLRSSGEGATCLHHSSSSALALVRPRGQSRSTSTRVPSTGPGGSYTRRTWTVSSIVIFLSADLDRVRDVALTRGLRSAFDVVSVRPSSRPQQGEEHHRGFRGFECMGGARGHMEPQSGTEIELLAVDGETQPSRQNLDHGGPAGLMLTEPLSSVEAEHGHIELVITVDDLGDHRARLDGDLVGGRKSDVRHMSSFMFRLSMLDWPARGRGDQKSLSPTGPKAFSDL